jgi:regulator of cell morphogenesis and NO signaling
MIQTQTKTIGEIATANPATIKVFQKHGIDFCCGGKRPLGEVCSEQGLDFEKLQDELANAVSPAAEPVRDWSAAPLSELIDHILGTHHAYLKEELPRLEQLVERVASKHGEHHGESLSPLRAGYVALKEELDMHLQKEEMILFPYIRQAERSLATGEPLPHSCFGSVEGPIRMMEFEHDSAGEALRRMRDVTGNYNLPEDACNSYRGLFHGLQALEADLHLHIHKENNILFPRARKL